MSSIKEPSLRSERSERSTSSSVRSKKAPSLRSHDSRSESSHSSKAPSHASSHSKFSRGSAASNLSRKSLEQKAEAAGLRAEAAVLKRKREAELEAELLEFDQKIKRAEAMEKVYAEGEERVEEEAGREEDEFARLRKRHKKANGVRVKGLKERKKLRKQRKHKEVETNVNSSQSFDETLLKVLQIQSAPKVNIDTFSGEVLEYQYFIETFREVVERTIFDERGRLTRLIQSTTGEPKELIRHCIHEDKDSCYTQAMDLLKRHYGDPHRIATAYLKELRQWPNLSSNDSSGFRSFNRFLIKCKCYKKDHFLRELDSADTLRTLVLKLPLNLQERWNRKADSTKANKGRLVEFADFCDFIDSESRLANDPLFSREALHAGKDTKQPPAVQSFATLVEDEQPSAKPCHMCSSSHDLDDCDRFKQMSNSAKVKFLYDKKLCFSCYASKAGHISKTCTQKRICTICNGTHPTGMHRFEDIPTRSTVQQLSEEDELVSMCVMPVRLTHKDNPGKEVIVYAVLDDCCKGTFVLENVLEGLDIPEGKPATAIVNTMIGKAKQNITKVKGLVVKCSRDHQNNYPSSRAVSLPVTLAREMMIPVDEDEMPTPGTVGHWKHLSSIVDKLPSYDPSIPFGLLIGANCPKALEPHEVINSPEIGPYAFRSQLGWCVVGPLGISSNKASTKGSGISMGARITTIDASTNALSKHHFAVQEEAEDTKIIKEMLTRMYDSEFNDVHSEKTSLSQEDCKFMSIMENNCQLVAGHYQLPLPFRSNNVKMPYNKQMAVQRLNSLKRKFSNHTKFCTDYTAFMSMLINKGYAQLCTIKSNSTNWKGWFVPHHGTYHPNKPDKIRVVFDCSARFKEVALNTELLQGPDLANLQIGVFLRFREEEVPFTADIECMFYQVWIPPEQRCYVRFLWWPDGDLSAEACEYEMCVHIFGAISSPGVANFALRKCATDYRVKYGELAYQTMMKNFYVDDLLKSVCSEKEAASLASSVDGMCGSGGFNLTKFTSPSRSLLESLPPEKRANLIDDVSMPKGEVVDRPLGVTWCLERDTLKFRIMIENKPPTRIGMLSTISTTYDPDGTAGPFLLGGRKILQEVTAEKVSWDEKVTDQYIGRWEKWKDDLKTLQHLEIPRCFKPPGFGEVMESALHTFSDASEIGYGMCSYLRQVNVKGDIHVALVLAKSRVAPLKLITIPRLELAAAALGSKIRAMLKEELMIKGLKEKFWVDSKIVLGYILNEKRRYKTYVANRVQKILSVTEKKQWDYIDTKENPADYCSRGISPNDTSKVEKWFKGPSFLWQEEGKWVKEENITEYSANDEEIKKVKEVKVNLTIIDFLNIIEILELRVSRWSRMKRIVAWVHCFIRNCRKEVIKGKENKERRDKINKRLDTQQGISEVLSLKVEDVNEGEITILRLVQEHYMSEEVSKLRKEEEVNKCSHLRRLDPFIDSSSLMRVGGRLKAGCMEVKLKFPIIIPKKSIIARRIAEWCHMMVEHTGRTSSLNELRARGYWVINGSGIMKSIVYKCVHCRALRGKMGQQKMADLPKERIQPEAPFTYVGVDMFGPFYIKEGRKELKRYGALFTCFSSRAIHIEVTHSLNTDSFILALRRFVARRGAVRTMRSDNGGNFEGADNETKRAYKEMDHQKIKDFLAENNCDWMEWERNPPTASHMGGVWERQIRSVREILQSLLKSNAHILNDESLHTLLLEAEAIVNSRPLTTENLNDPDSMPLTPSRLLTMKSKLILPPPGVFQKEDIYSRKRWRRVQHIANEFWQRWRKEFLSSLQQRQKWTTTRRNFAVGDIVLLRDDDFIRNHWPRGIIVETYPDHEGLVRTVKIRQPNTRTLLTRPIAKIVLLVETLNE